MICGAEEIKKTIENHLGIHVSAAILLRLELLDAILIVVYVGGRDHC